MRICLSITVLFLFFGVMAKANDLPVYTYEIVKTFSHDAKAFTQGLVFYDGFLYEGTGEKGESSVRKVELQTGKVMQKIDLSDKFFGEGITILGGKIYQLTWKEKTVFVYDVNNLQLLEEIKYQGSGWGLTHDGTNLILSDGTDVIKFIDPQTFATLRTIAVKREDEKPVYHLNELEYVKGEIWANVWHSDQMATKNEHGFLPNLGKPNYIVRINPNTGKVVGWIDLANIAPTEKPSTLNGIAYDAVGERIFVTGKNWKNLFEIKVKSKS